MISDMIKAVRKDKQLTQSQLGELIGVQKSQISKLENGTSNMTIGTIFRIFEAMKSQIRFEVQSEENIVPA